MPTGRRYALLIYSYNGSTETFISKQVVTVGTSDYTLSLPVGLNYRWYAFSFNQTNAPLLMANGSFSLTSGVDQNTDILFKHQTNRIELQIDVMQYFATSQTVVASLNNQTLVTSNYNLKTRATSGTATATTSNTALTFTNGYFNGTATAAIKRSTNEIYTSQANPTINARITSLTVTKNGQTSVPVISSPTSVSVSISGFSNSTHKIKRGTVKIIEKSIDVPPLTIAQGNLYYDSNDPLNPYKFGPARTSGGDAADACNYYFNWNTLLPRSQNFPSDLYGTGDPCKEVLPKNSWRTPNLSDATFIASLAPDLVSASVSSLYLPLPGGLRLYFWDNGTATDNTTGRQCIIGNIDDGQYWTSVSNTTNKAIIIYMDGGPEPWLKIATTLGGTNYYDRNKDEGRPVRCVKNSN